MLGSLRLLENYREGEVEMLFREEEDPLNRLPTLCIWARNSLSDILPHSLLSFALIRWSSCINFGSFLFIYLARVEVFLKKIPLDFAASLRIEEIISCGVLLFHSFVICALILWSSCINFGSFIATLAHLLGRTYVYLYIAAFFVYRICADTRFMSYYMLEVPTHKSRNFMHRSNSYMQGVRQIFMRYYVIFDINLGKFFRLLCSENLFKSVFPNGIKKFFTPDWIRSSFDFNNDEVGNIKRIIISPRYFKEILCCLFDPRRIFSVQPVYNRGINIYSHDAKNTIEEGESQGISMRGYHKK